MIRNANESAYEGLPNVKYERVIINSVPAMNIKATLHFTAKLKMLKVEVKDKGHNG